LVSLLLLFIPLFVLWVETTSLMIYINQHISLLISLLVFPWTPNPLYLILLYLSFFTLQFLFFLYLFVSSFPLVLFSILFLLLPKPFFVKIEEGGLDLLYFSFHFYFSFQFIFLFFYIFRTTRVRVDWSRCHISHLMA